MARSERMPQINTFQNENKTKKNTKTFAHDTRWLTAADPLKSSNFAAQFSLSICNELPVHVFVSSYVSSVHQFCARHIDFDGQMNGGHLKMPSQRYHHIGLSVGLFTLSPHFYGFTLRQISDEPNCPSNGLCVRINFVLWHSEKSYDRNKFEHILIRSVHRTLVTDIRCAMRCDTMPTCCSACFR